MAWPSFFAAAAVWLAAADRSAGDQEAGVIRLSPVDDCAAVVRTSPAGSTFLFAPGLYRGLEIAPRDGDSFFGSQTRVWHSQS